jgi:hypothetical protein
MTLMLTFFKDILNNIDSYDSSYKIYFDHTLVSTTSSWDRHISHHTYSVVHDDNRLVSEETDLCI